MLRHRHIAALPLALLLAACSHAPKTTASGPSRHLYVWAGTGTHTTRGVDLLVALDADPSSPHYGAVLAAVTADTDGRMPHHTELSVPAHGFLFANDYSADKSYLLDLGSPTSPRLVGRLAPVPSGRNLHSFARLPNGHVIATVQFGDSTVSGAPGGLAEFDGDGKLVRVGWSRDSAFPGARIRTYALTLVPASDRIVTTSAPMDTEKTANVVQSLAALGPHAPQDTRGPHGRRRLRQFQSVRSAHTRRRQCAHEQLSLRLLPHHGPRRHAQDRTGDGDVGVEPAELRLLRPGDRRPLHDHAGRVRAPDRDDRHCRPGAPDRGRVIRHRYEHSAALGGGRPGERPDRAHRSGQMASPW